MPTVELAIVVGGQIKDRQAIPVRKAKVLLADILPDGGTADEQAAALLAWVIARSKDALSGDAPRIGDRQYDVMLAAVAAVDNTWDADRVMRDGMTALESAYDAL